ncbi:unnamed protein product [Withania somnifera]
MVKKSKKSKSKRVSLKQKHKIIRKVKEHQKKKAKEAKKLGINKKTKVEKDPRIPNDWPFKEQELKAFEARRARAKKRNLGRVEDDDVYKLADMVSGEQNFMEDKGDMGNNDSTTFVKIRNNLERGFYKELVKVIDASDVILEVLDARDPLGARCLDMEKMVMRSGPGKHLLLLLNKIEELPAVSFKCSTQEQKSNLGWKSSLKAGKTTNLLQTSDCLGAENLIKLLKNSQSHEIKKSITVGVSGLPNVGKSSLINSLKRSHIVNVGATPGLTRSMQEVQLDKNVKLLDCPVIVMLRSSTENDAAIALRNCKRIEKLDDLVGPVKEILKLCPARMLITIYKVPSFDSVDDFLQKVATVRGRLKQVEFWKIPYYTMPQSRNEGEHSEVKIVSELGKEFNVDEVYGSESSIIGSLKSVDDFHPVEVLTNCPVNFDETMLEDNMEQAVTQSDNAMDTLVTSDIDVAMDAGEDDAGRTSDKSASRQYEKRKKDKASTTGDMMDGDYDFKVDYFKKESIMDNAEADMITDKSKKNRFELPSGNELDNE